MKIGAALLLLLLSLCFAAIVAVKMIVDESWLQQKIVAALGQRAATVGSFQLDLLPPAVELRQVLIGSPEAFSDGQFIKLGRARLELDVLSLLAGPLVVENITVSDFSMHLVRDQVGRENWKNPEAETEAVPAEQRQLQLPQVLVKQIDIDNLSIAWHDLESNKTVSFNNFDLMWNLDDADFPLRANWDFEVGPDIAKAVAQLQGKAIYADGVVGFSGLQLNADIASPYLVNGKGRLEFNASPEFNVASGGLRVDAFSLLMPGVDLQGAVELRENYLAANVDLTVERLREAIAITGVGPVLDELGISEGLSGPVSLQLPEIGFDRSKGELKLLGFNFRGIGMDISADISLSGKNLGAANAKVKLDGNVENVALFWKLAAAIQPENRDRWRSLAEAYQAPSRRTASLGIELELAAGDLTIKRADIIGMGIRAQSEQLQWYSSSGHGQGKLDIAVSELDRLLGALFGAEAEWAGRFSGVSLKADLAESGNQIDMRLDMLDRLSVARRFTLQAPIKIDVANATVSIQQMSLFGPGLHFGGALEAKLATASGTARLEFIEADPHDLLDMFIDLKDVDDKLLHRLEGLLELEFSANQSQLAMKGLKLDDASIDGILSKNGDLMEFDLEVAQLNLDYYLSTTSNDKKKQPDLAADKSQSGKKLLPDAIQDTLRELKLSGEVLFVDLVAGQMQMPQLLLKVMAADGVLDVGLSSDAFYEGNMDGLMQIDVTAKPATMMLEFDASGIATAPLLDDLSGKGIIAGELNLKLDFDSKNGTLQHVLDKLVGQASINIGEGKVLGIDIVQKLRQITDISQLLSGAGDSSSDSTEFTSLAATVAVADGLASNVDLVMLSPLFAVNGNGQYDLSKNDINYTLVLGFESESDAVGNLAGLQLPINIKGSLPKPSYSVDVSQIPIGSFAKFLPGLLGKGVGSSTGKVIGTLQNIIGGGDSDKQEGEQGDSDKGKVQDKLQEKAVDQVKKLLPF